MDQTSRHSGLTRRTFLKTSALTAGALAAAGAAGCSSIDANTPAQDSQSTEEQVFASNCRGNCGGWCILDVKVREGKIASTMNRVTEGVPEATLGCVKGLSNIGRIYGTGRVTHPLKRVEGTERGAGEWEQITWDEAFDIVGKKFKSIIDEHGGQAIGIWEGAGNVTNYVNGVLGVGLNRFKQRFGTTWLDYGSDQCSWFMRGALGVPNCSVEDAQNAKTIVLWGHNPAAAGSERSTWKWVCKAREDGAKIIVVDPFFSESAAQADKWIPVRSSTDGALMCAMIHHIVDNKLYNEDYLKNKSIAPLLIKEDGFYLRLSELDMPLDKSKDPETDEPVEIDSPVVWDEDAQAFVSHKAAKNPAFTGMFDANGVAVRTVFDVSMESIAPFTMDYAVKECGVAADDIIEFAEACAQGSPTLLALSLGVEHTYNCFHLYYNVALLASLIGACGTPGAAYNTPGGPASKLWKAPIALNRSALVVDDPLPNKKILGEYMIDFMETGKYGNEDFTLNAVLNYAHNPIDNACDPLGIIKAWDKIGFVVTLDSFMTTSAMYSDIVLPVTMQFEREDFTAGPFEAFLQMKCIDPLGEAKDDYDILRGIAEAMGDNDLFTKTSNELLHEYLDTPENVEAGLSYDDYASAGGAIAGDYVYSEAPAVDAGPLGRTQFYVEQFKPRYDFGQSLEDHDRLPYYKPAAEAYLDNPEREKYPLFGFFNHEVYHGQSMHAHNPWLDQFRTCEGEPRCFMHETAAAERGIKTGDLIRCFNARGSVVLRAVLTKGIREDSVLLPHGFFKDEFIEGFVQSLTGHNIDPQTQNANFNDMILQVEKYEGSTE